MAFNNIKSGLIGWMAGHPVAANLLMLIFIFGGLFFYDKSTKEVFPEFTLDSISVSMAYPGASPEEVEQGIILAIEGQIKDVNGIGEVTSTAREGYGYVTAEVIDVNEMIRIAQDIKSAVDRITTFPVDAEDLTVAVNNRRRDVISMALYGNASQWDLRAKAEQILDILEQDPDIGYAEISGSREYEIHIEISQENLRRYNLSLPDVAQTIRQSAIEVGGGSLETKNGEVLVRMAERRDNALEFRDIPIITQNNGSTVRLGDIANIRDGFDDTDNYAFFNSSPAIIIDVFRVGSQTPVSVSEAVQRQVDNISATLPDGLKMATFNDRSQLFKQRAHLLIKNGIFGLILVIIFLALFLDLRLAFWVGMGIPISFMGAFLLLPATSFTVNIVSMFAFIMALGIVVDDAIISGENIYRYRQKGISALESAIKGAKEIAVPMTISILTNIVAFAPMLFVPGSMGKVFSVIPVVVISVFFISLVESLFILPAHLTFKPANSKPNSLLSIIANKQKSFNQAFQTLITQFYAPFLENFVIRYRYISLALFVAILLAVGGYVASGRMGMVLFPSVESDYAYASATLRFGSPYSDTKAVSDRLISAARAVIKKMVEILFQRTSYLQ